ncbi:hypothetical protein O6H91_13G042300 [Diphasiastrum complanatum]|uniref:Uncharacterized protein n=1 Tax=Diphasiastrum complanatum TaxID=34168 RepID=A0ACC2BU55_DIPCM|nr:hypothetical protein O6H91_13G042300 [Diphasiastrum complanatum]
MKRTCYAQTSQITQIRKKMREIMVRKAQSCDLKELVAKFILEMIGKDIEKATSRNYPLQNESEITFLKILPALLSTWKMKRMVIPDALKALDR